jgi:hypothetical protein
VQTLEFISMDRVSTRWCWRVTIWLVATVFLASTLPIRDLQLLESVQQRSASAQTPGLTIQVFDYTGRWGKHIELGVQRWDAALAYRNIRLQYVRQSAVACESLSQPAYGISVCDNAGAGPAGWLSDGEHQGIWATQDGIRLQGRVRFYIAAPNSDFADDIVCHEIGHTLQLQHVPDKTDSCMTAVPSHASPSAMDATNALSYIPSLLPSVETPGNGKHHRNGKGGKKGKKHVKKHGH